MLLSKRMGYWRQWTAPPPPAPYTHTNKSSWDTALLPQNVTTLFWSMTRTLDWAKTVTASETHHYNFNLLQGPIWIKICLAKCNGRFRRGDSAVWEALAFLKLCIQFILCIEQKQSYGDVSLCEQYHACIASYVMALHSDCKKPSPITRTIHDRDFSRQVSITQLEHSSEPLYSLLCCNVCDDPWYHDHFNQLCIVLHTWSRSSARTRRRDMPRETAHVATSPSTFWRRASQWAHLRAADRSFQLYIVCLCLLNVRNLAKLLDKSRFFAIFAWSVPTFVPKHNLNFQICCNNNYLSCENSWKNWSGKSAEVKYGGSRTTLLHLRP